MEGVVCDSLQLRTLTVESGEVDLQHLHLLVRFLAIWYLRSNQTIRHVKQYRYSFILTPCMNKLINLFQFDSQLITYTYKIQAGYNCSGY